jgi:hypothetical protein
MGAIFRIYTSYEPLRVFSIVGFVLGFLALGAWAPFLWDWWVNGDRNGHLQSLLLGGILLVASIQVFVLGFMADAIAANRVVTQRTLERVRRIELQLGVPPSHYLPGRRAAAEDDGPGEGSGETHNGAAADTTHVDA